jgi:hypothetical protein
LQQLDDKIGLVSPVENVLATTAINISILVYHEVLIDKIPGIGEVAA